MDEYGGTTRLPGTTRRALLSAGLALALAGCSTADGVFGGGRQLRIMVPTPPGGGFDHTARTIAAVLEDTALAPSVTVFNLPGNRGTAALSRLLYERGTPDLLLQMGLGLVANTHVNTGSARVTEATPIARLLEEPEVILVPASSEYDSIDDLLQAWRRDPGAMRIGGGSTPGGPDHLVTMLLATELGIDLAEVDYRSYDGGGPMQAALLRREVDFAAAGHSEQRSGIESGQLRVLAITSAKPDEELDAPTLRQAGIDLEFNNWRGLLAPPGLSEEERSRLLDLVEDLHSSSQWAERLERNRWSDAYLAGEDFGDFLAEEDARTSETLGRLGLA